MALPDQSRCIRAWLQYTNGYVAAHFVAAGTNRGAAVRLFPTEAAARAWVELQAEELDAVVEWINN